MRNRRIRWKLLGCGILFLVMGISILYNPVFSRGGVFSTKVTVDLGKMQYPTAIAFCVAGLAAVLLGLLKPKILDNVICPKCETPYAYAELTNGMCPVCLVKVVDTKEYYEQAKEGGTGGAPDAGEVGDKGAAENTDGLSGESGQPPQPPSGEA